MSTFYTMFLNSRDFGNQSILYVEHVFSTFFYILSMANLVAGGCATRQPQAMRTNFSWPTSMKNEFSSLSKPLNRGIVIWHN